VLLQMDVVLLELQLKTKQQQIAQCQARIVDRESRLADYATSSMRPAAQGTQGPAELRLLVSDDVKRIVEDTASGSGSAEQKITDLLVLWHPGQTACNVSSPTCL